MVGVKIKEKLGKRTNDDYIHTKQLSLSQEVNQDARATMYTANHHFALDPEAAILMIKHSAEQHHRAVAITWESPEPAGWQWSASPRWTTFKVVIAQAVIQRES